MIANWFDAVFIRVSNAHITVGPMSYSSDPICLPPLARTIPTPFWLLLLCRLLLQIVHVRPPLQRHRPLRPHFGRIQAHRNPRNIHSCCRSPHWRMSAYKRKFGSLTIGMQHCRGRAGLASGSSAQLHPQHSKRLHERKRGAYPLRP